jgi:bifunctional oligoribonuclease and PAP phosphatase NrnA
MSERSSPSGAQRQAAAARLAAATSIIIATHDRPDGDAIGSVMALALAARAAGKSVQVVLDEPVPRRYAFLTVGEKLLPSAAFGGAVASCDCAVILDTSTVEQLRALAKDIPAARDKLVVIDHHQTWQDIAAIRWSDPSRAAAGVMVLELLDELGWPLLQPVARAIFTAVCADTGWMQYANTDARALAAAGRCLEAGVAVDELYRTLFQNDRPQRLALLGRMLAGMTLHAAHRVALMTITRDDFAQTGAAYDETENLINEALRIGSVAVAVLLVEQQGEIRGSMRSKRPADSDAPVVDVAKVAQSLGGGGHERASGFRMAAPLEQVTQSVLAAVQKELL